MTGSDVADSTDWLPTPLYALSSVESALRCQVCKDFYETPMITSCSHTFCSLCIRRALSSENKCPLCRAAEQEVRLRSNWSMEEAVEAFKKARSAVLDLARSGTSGCSSSPKRKAAAVEELEAQPAPETKRLRSSARLSRNRVQQAPSYAPGPDEAQIMQVADDDDDYIPEPADGLVPCPSCQKRMKEWQVFTHLETCPGPTSGRKSPERNAITQLGASQWRQNKSLERLPAVNYSMLKDNALRKKMVDLGIPNQGPRPLLEKRHKEWVTLWNANCDAARPKKRTELLQDLETWEKTQGGRAPTGGKALQNAAIIKDKGFDGSAWAAQHDSSFKNLIANARNSSAKSKQETDGDKSSNEKTPGKGALSPESKDGRHAISDTRPQQDGRGEQPILTANGQGEDPGDTFEEPCLETKPSAHEPEAPTIAEPILSSQGRSPNNQIILEQALLDDPAKFEARCAGEAAQEGAFQKQMEARIDLEEARR